MSNTTCQSYTIYVQSIGSEIQSLIDQRGYSSVFILVDQNTREHCLPIIQNHISTSIHEIEIPAGEIHKTIVTCQHIWNGLIEGQADRKSLLINLGGGVIGDMGGFCASTYMRGLDFVQIPTTLLSMVDASVGAKLGIDYKGYKNLIGLFNEPQAIYVDPNFLQTLDPRELRSGFAEIIKHALIQDEKMWEEIQAMDLTNYNNWQTLIEQNIQIKKRIVESDPFEKGARKALNFGHTIGHAIEKQYLESSSPLLHGEAIAIGMICESYLSHQEGHLQKEDLETISKYISDQYPNLPTSLHSTSQITSALALDKKSKKGIPMFSLLDNIGNYRVNVSVGASVIDDSLKYYNSLHNN